MSHKFYTYIRLIKYTYVDLIISITSERHQLKCRKNLRVKFIPLNRHRILESYITNSEQNKHQTKKLKVIY